MNFLLLEPLKHVRLGSVLAIIRENHPPKPTFKVDDVPDLEGKVIIITGANAGEKLFMSIHNVG